MTSYFAGGRHYHDMRALLGYDMSALLGAVASFSIWVLALGVKNRRATVKEAKIALWLVIAWVIMQVPIYDTFSSTVVWGLSGTLAYLAIPITFYANFPIACLWVHWRQKRQILRKGMEKNGSAIRTDMDRNESSGGMAN